LNSDALTRTTPSRWRVYLFHHLGTSFTKKDGRGGRTRTHDRRFWRPLLYQLSYTPAPTGIIIYYNMRRQDHSIIVEFTRSFSPSLS
jgi:hypothetical protein